MWAQQVRERVRRLRIGKGYAEAQLVFDDGSFLHFRHDPYTRWLQAWTPDAGGVAPEFVPRIERFRLKRRHLEVWFDDGSRLEARLGMLGTRIRTHE
ncbi:hypothetical protein [Oceanithermus sp.]|uniref:hypothetical protein n=1 Tax=Oceanithermus sp. TaxID=2268145 RepID=UPI0025D8225F|nr:hypothetical protein [Oceanithermus sp.]